uniref:Box C/D snoRNA protein 1 n=1 Tax=Photinus pyralis TaxID=7054 RepID=A0A1Y1M1X0_PHOPY
METSESVPSSSKLGSCEVCARNEAQYTCPRCEVKTCCLACAKVHKQELECSGIRDRTKYIPINKFTNLDLSSDYRLLEEITRSVDLLKKNSSRKPTRLNHELPNHLYKLSKATTARKTTLKFLPRNFVRHKRNTTRLHFASDVVYWHIDWIFPNADNLKLCDDNVPETERLSTLTHRHLANENKLIRERLQYYIAVDLPGIKLLLKAEQKPGQKYYELDPLESLKDNLRNKIIIEYPTIHVVLKEHLHLYDVIESDEEVYMDASVCNGNDLANRIIKSAEEDDLDSSLKNLLFISEYSDEEISD